MHLFQRCDDAELSRVDRNPRVIIKERVLLETSSNNRFEISEILSSHYTNKKLIGKENYL